MNQLRTRGFASSWLLLVLAVIGACQAALGEGMVAGWGSQVVLATPLKDAQAITAGASHNLALKSDGTVAGWGYDSAGQATPQAGLNGVVAIAAGYSHSLAVIGSPSAPCLVDISLGYSAGALSIRQAVGSTAARNIYASALVSPAGVTQLVSPRGLPAIAPPRLFLNSIPLGSVGTVGVLGRIYLLDSSSGCYDFATVDTGGPGASVEELKQMLRRSGLAPKDF